MVIVAIDVLDYLSLFIHLFISSYFHTEYCMIVTLDFILIPVLFPVYIFFA